MNGFSRVLTLALAVVLMSSISADAYFATCTGSTPCNACKNCKYCKHCAKEGGKCGICKRERQESSRETVQP
jgi:hypothetical protein